MLIAGPAATGKRDASRVISRLISLRISCTSQGMSDETAILAANAAYYGAFAAADIAAMSRVWADDNVSCIHPGWPALVGRPVQAGKADRYPYFSFLVSKALSEGDSDAALNHINEGMRIDCESNEGKRREDYETRRAAVHVGRGEADEAEAVYWEDLRKNPGNVWTLFGLLQAQKAQGKQDEAALTEERFKRAAKDADFSFAR